MPASPISAISLAAMLAQETDEVFVMLATLTHASLPQPLRVCSDYTPIISNDPVTGLPRYFIGFRFDIQFPSDSESQGLSTAQATIENVDPMIGDAILQLTVDPIGGTEAPIHVTIEFVRAAAPDFIEVNWDFLRMRSIKVDDPSVTGTLSYEDIANEPLSPDFTPSTYPGVFG